MKQKTLVIATGAFLLPRSLSFAKPAKKTTRKKPTAKVAASIVTKSKPMNRTLHAAKKNKNDEFYTQLPDIEKELKHYTKHFKGKVVYCNCDDPNVSQFFHYFAANFNKLGLKKLITTCYNNRDPDLFSKNEYKPGVYLVYEGERNGNNRVYTANQIGIRPLAGDGDFRSEECIALLKEADIVVTNPPFSLFREYVEQLVKHKKKFIVIGSVQAVTYKEVFPLIKAGKLWMGATIHSGGLEFRVPDNYPLNADVSRVDENGVKYISVKGARWFTNLDHGRRPQKLPLMTMADNIRYNKKLKGKAYDHYDNYDAIEVSFYDAIPSDYDGVMGVPITFLDKYNPKQFEIVGNSYDSRIRPVGREFISAYRASGGTVNYSQGMRMLCLLQPNPRLVFKRILIRKRDERKSNSKKSQSKS